ncbi:recombinase family protein [Streptomyces sp. NPDC057363]|uniref:recombinase family protein n=1 Tax=Streptomyces sp. NPDC057363 TaxID=3346107 RepID=UPI00363A62DD
MTSAATTDVQWTDEELKELASLERMAADLPKDARRALLSVRLSVLTDETTSPARTELDLRRDALRRGWRVVGVARDLNVSATKVPPWKRKELGEWLTNRVPEYDVIMFWKLDRFVRRISDLHVMIGWCKEWSKDLVALNDPIDLSTEMGQVMVTLIAGMARIEAVNTGTRISSLWKYSRNQKDRWLIGKPVYGFTTEQAAEYRVQVVHPEQARVLKWAYAMLKRRRSVSRITYMFRRAGIPSATGKDWGATTLSKLLKNPALMGYKVYKPEGSNPNLPSKIAYGDDGNPVVLSEGVFTPEEFEEIQTLLLKRPGATRVPSTKKLSRFLGVAKCPHCAGNLKRDRQEKRNRKGETKVYDYLRCNQPKDLCPGFTVSDPETVYGAMTDVLLGELGDMEVEYRDYVRGADTAKRVGNLQASLTYYMEGLKPGGMFAVGGYVQQQAQESLQKLNAELSEIDPESTKDRWEYKSQGITYRQRWQKEGLEAMEADLLRSGIKFVVHSADTCDLLLPEKLRESLILKKDEFQKAF